MFDAKEVARLALERAAEIEARRRRLRRYAAMSMAAACLCAAISFMAAFGLTGDGGADPSGYARLADEGLVIIGDETVPLTRPAFPDGTDASGEPPMPRCAEAAAREGAPAPRAR
ncbi:MAG: hypothetical protein FWE70_06720 [Oscillospiraceae bacterium]|nr:hypothetical protein [Oscillospiraceae bacterium]